MRSDALQVFQLSHQAGLRFRRRQFDDVGDDLTDLLLPDCLVVSELESARHLAAHADQQEDKASGNESNRSCFKMRDEDSYPTRSQTDEAKSDRRSASPRVDLER